MNGRHVRGGDAAWTRNEKERNTRFAVSRALPFLDFLQLWTKQAGKDEYPVLYVYTLIK